MTRLSLARWHALQRKQDMERHPIVERLLALGCVAVAVFIVYQYWSGFL